MKNLFLICTLILVGCATTKTLQAVNGSKSDGTVKLAYEYGLFEKPVIDWNLAEITAKQRCKAWGYKKAEKFGGEENKCLSYNGYGNCLEMQVNITYQCTER
jgi:YecR-like lipoprotein